MTSELRRAYLRPLPCAPMRPNARPLAGGLFGYAEIEVLRRGAAPEILPVDAVEALHPEEAETLALLSMPRPVLAGLDLARPRIMGVINVTPDSFSDGGLLADAETAVAHGLALAEAGADILDIGGESTRPGAKPIGLDEPAPPAVSPDRGRPGRDVPQPGRYAHARPNTRAARKSNNCGQGTRQYVVASQAPVAATAGSRAACQDERRSWQLQRPSHHLSGR